MRIHLCKLQVLARFGDRIRHDVEVERARRREALSSVDDDPHPDRLRGPRSQRLDLAVVRLYVGGATTRHVHLELLTGLGPADHVSGELRKLGVLGDRSRHDAVPPIVSAVTRSVG